MSTADRPRASRSSALASARQDRRIDRGNSAHGDPFAGGAEPRAQVLHATLSSVDDACAAGANDPRPDDEVARRRLGSRPPHSPMLMTSRSGGRHPRELRAQHRRASPQIASDIRSATQIAGLALQPLMTSRRGPHGCPDSYMPKAMRRAVAALQIAVARERPEREKLRIAVVAQIEDARETRRRCNAPRPRSRPAPGSRIR